MRHFALYLTMATLLAAPALAQQSPPPAPATMNTASPADKALTGSMDRMNHGMAVKMSGNADQDFAHMMLAHHEGAVDMAKVELQYGKDLALRAMAKNIVIEQSKEIKECHDWQAKHPASK